MPKKPPEGSGNCLTFLVFASTSSGGIRKRIQSGPVRRVLIHVYSRGFVHRRDLAGVYPVAVAPFR